MSLYGELVYQDSIIKAMNGLVGEQQTTIDTIKDNHIRNLAILLTHIGGQALISVDVVNAIYEYEGEILVDVKRVGMAEEGEKVQMTLEMKEAEVGK